MTSHTASHTTSAPHAGRRVVLVFALFVALFFMLLMGLRLAIRTPPRSLPVLGQLSDASLTERTGQKTSLSQLRGKVLLIRLHPADCGAPCEEIDRQMAEIQRWNGPVSKEVLEVTIVEKPESLGALDARARRYGADSSWRWFAADPDAFAALSRELLPEPQKADIAIVDVQGRIRRRYLLSNSSDRPDLMLDNRALVLESKTR